MRLQVGNFPSRLDFEGRVAIGGALGYGSIGLGGDQIDAYMARNAMDELKGYLARHNMAVANVSLGPSYNMEGDQWKQALALAEKRAAAVAGMVSQPLAQDGRRGRVGVACDQVPRVCGHARSV
jgi:hypothetical protein